MKRAGRWASAAATLLASAAMLVGAITVHAQDDADSAAPSNPHKLPETDMGVGAMRHYLDIEAGVDATGAASLAHAAAARNPQAPDAIPIGSATCVACHSQENLQFSHTIHARALRSGALGSNADRTCESCHGPGSLHAASPTVAGSIIAFTHGSATSVETQTETCLGCHTGGARQHWIGSIHEARGLSCSDCHNPMAKMSPEGLLTKQSISETCAGCHRDVRAKFNRRSHMPLPEGQISCVDCHNPHGSITDPLLKTDTVNGTCYTCHAEKRGPLLFEHPPVRENCLNCHDPHGSNQQTLLVAPLPMLCQQCHTMTRHPNDLQTPAGFGTGSAPDERLMGRACISCHTNIHGSNNPSGAKFHK